MLSPCADLGFGEPLGAGHAQLPQQLCDGQRVRKFREYQRVNNFLLRDGEPPMRRKGEIVSLGRGLGRDGFVNVLFLGRVHADQRLDRLDHALRVPHKIAVDLL